VNTRRLYRSRYEKQLAGVAGGMAEYLEVDPTLVRILWILSAFLGGFTILLYIVLAFIMPLAPLGYRPGGPGPSWAPGGTWGPGTAPVGPAPMPGAAPVAGAEGTAEGVTGATGDASPTQGWNAAQAGWDPAWTGSQGWTAQTPEAAADRRRGPGAAVYAGVVLVVFGGIALVNTVIPGLAGISLGPALLLALGVALLVGSMRRTPDEA